MGKIDNIKVGDKVIRSKTNSIGTVVKITEKRKDVVVDYGNYQETYRPDGWQKTSDIYFASSIELLTPELEEELNKKQVIKRCQEKFKNQVITYEQAIKILDILELGSD